jgi:hypothetical protein
MAKSLIVELSHYSQLTQTGSRRAMTGNRGGVQQEQTETTEGYLHFLPQAPEVGSASNSSANSNTWRRKGAARSWPRAFAKRAAGGKTNAGNFCARSCGPWLVERLEIFRRVLAVLETELDALTRAVAAAAPATRPKGLGGLTGQIIGREVCDCLVPNLFQRDSFGSAAPNFFLHSAACSGLPQAS